jgi:serine protein kinase
MYEHLQDLSANYKDQFLSQRVILSFKEYMDTLMANPYSYMRSSAAYIRDVLMQDGMRDVPGLEQKRFCVFDIGSERSGPIIGGERVHENIYEILDTFARQGFINKLIVMHGPNGSAKSSTIDAIADAMFRYSKSPEGAVYTFNWIFPTDRSANPTDGGMKIGFGKDEDIKYDSYATLDESKIACKLASEFRDNPIYLIPMPYREKLLQSVTDDIPPHVLLSGLSKKNQLIFENLLNAYDGDFDKVMRHVQIERFYYSKQYRVGLATVDPQVVVDAAERQLTMDKNISNLPAFLHNIRFTEASGALVEANRGLVEFSDMLKRPLETYKYLLNAIEKGSINLPSSTAHLDVVYMATTNEQHLDAFKATPDFSSFRSRFELVTVPYLLRASEEEKIYAHDMRVIAKKKRICPHTLRCVCLWAVMSRFKQPDPEKYDTKYRTLVARLDPRHKVKLYEGESLQPVFKAAEETLLRSIREDIYQESQNVTVYEGRFGASPREVKQILSRAAAQSKFRTLTPMAIFAELKKIIKDKSVYEFLQYEPRSYYHDVAHFIKEIEREFLDQFEHELLLSMSLVEDDEYDTHLKRYIDHVVAYIKKEKLLNPRNGQYDEPSEELMKDVEKVLHAPGPAEKFRQDILSRIAAYRIEHKTTPIDVSVIFADHLRRIQEHYHNEKRAEIEKLYKSMLSADADKDPQARHTYAKLEQRFGYDRESAEDCLRFLMANLRR